jgi:hypothetical protein
MKLEKETKKEPRATAWLNRLVFGVALLWLATVTAAVADVSLRPCTCRAEQGFASTEAGSDGPSVRRQNFFYILIPAFLLGLAWMGVMSACGVVHVGLGRVSSMPDRDL